MPALPHALRHPQRRFALAVALGIALVLAQWLGLVHHVVHPGAVHFGEHVQAHAAEHPGEQRLGGLFDGHDEGGADCHLFDQLTHADALGAMPCALPDVPPPHAPAAVHASWQRTAEAAGPLARGPPART